MEIAAHVSGRALSIGSQRQDVQRPAFQRRNQQNSVPPWNARAF